MANLTRKSGDGQYYDSGSQLWEFPYILKNYPIQYKWSMLIPLLGLINLLLLSFFRKFSNSIVSTGKAVSMPHLETGAILIDATEMFLTDVSYVSQNRKGQYRFDKK